MPMELRQNSTSMAIDNAQGRWACRWLVSSSIFVAWSIFRYVGMKPYLDNIFKPNCDPLFIYNFRCNSYCCKAHVAPYKSS
eukprot:5701675-Pleurochrysis_carterae.AAC.3